MIGMSRKRTRKKGLNNAFLMLHFFNMLYLAILIANVLEIYMDIENIRPDKNHSRQDQICVCPPFDCKD